MTTPPSASPGRFNVLLGVCGGIAAYKAVEVLRRIKEQGCDVRCALTRSARSFVGPLTFEALSENPVLGEEYLDATGSGVERHIEVADWADLVVIVPATAHFLARTALGLADDFLTTTLLAYEGPLVIAPAMHPLMWNKPAIQGHVKDLKNRDARFIGPEVGALANGEIGFGRLTDPGTIAEAVLRFAVGRGELAGLRVVISAGPTREPIDPVRYIGNRSTGKMGFALAAEAAARGAEVDLVAGPALLPTPPGVERIDVRTAEEMHREIFARASQGDLFIMTAAVSDFRPFQTLKHKIKKTQGVPDLKLECNPDILAALPEAAPDAVVVGFAAETENLELNAREKLQRKGSHFIVANDVSRADIGFGADLNEVTVFSRDGGVISIPKMPKRNLAVSLFDIFVEALRKKSHAHSSTSS